MSGVENASVSSEFDIFAERPIQRSVLGTEVTVYKPVDQKDLEFFIHSYSNINIDLDIKLYVRSKWVSGSGKMWT